LLVAVTCGAALYGGAGYIATDWLKVQQIPLSDVQLSLEYMAITVALRWMSGLYRGAISGYERLVWLSGFNAIIASLRFVGILPVLIYFSHQTITFFAYQLAVSVLEISGLIIYAYRLFPSLTKGEKLVWEWAPLKPVLKFSLTIGFLSLVWVFVTQVDKLILSKILTLPEYGHFTLAVLVASGILFITSPISSSIMPRMSKLEALGDHAGLIFLYRKSTQIVSALAGSTSITIALCAESLLFAWTGDRDLARESATILQLYALGNGVLALAAFPYYLQYAKGDLRLHFIGNLFFVLILTPVIIWASVNYGGVGAGYAWLIVNLISFFGWIPIVHNKFHPGLNLKWYLEDVFSIVVPSLFVGVLIIPLFEFGVTRWSIFCELITIGFLMILTACIGSSFIRNKIFNIFIGDSHKLNNE
jgi:O-antigen/teichoic acid export membrane protein